MTVRPKRLRLLVVTGHRIIPRKLESKIVPLLGLDDVAKVYLVTGSRFCHGKVRCFFPQGRLAAIPLVAHVWSVLTVLGILVRNAPDIVITVGLIPHGIYTLLLAAIFGCKKIFLSMGMNELIYNEDHRAGRMLRKIAFLSDLIGTRGTHSKAQLIRAGFDGNRIFIPHNVFDFDDFRPVSCEKIYDGIYVGLLEPYKRVDLLIETVHRLVSEKGVKQIQLAIVGDGSLKDDLQHQSRALGVQDHVTFLPAGNSDHVCRLLNQSRIFVMTSQGEGLPMAMIEAMSCGLPVVAFDHADIRDVADDGRNSLLCQPGDVESFVDKVEVILKSREVLDALAGKAVSIREEKQAAYSMENVQSLWEKALAII